MKGFEEGFANNRIPLSDLSDVPSLSELNVKSRKL